MKKYDQISFTLIVTYFFILTAFTSISWSSETSSGSQSQKSTIQIERERIEARAKWLNRPEERQVRQLLDELDRALEEYLDSKDKSSCQKCESLVEQSLALPKAGPKAYSKCATTANVLGQPRHAIEILKKAIVNYPDGYGWGPVVPLKISGYYRIGSIATYIGDANEATRAYEAVISNLKDLENGELFKIQGLMLLADIATGLLKDKELAMKRHREIVRELDSIDASKFGHDVDSTLKFLRGWTLYEQERLETGSAQSLQKLQLKKQEYVHPFMFVMTHVSMSQCSMPEMELIAESNKSSLDSIITRYALAINYMHHANINPPKVEKYFMSVAETDSYFKPYAEAGLKRVQEKVEKIRKEIPVLLSELKNGDLKQRENAASKLVWDAGPEGEKALQQAQQDPNKYVRYTAACCLARWGRDASIKADFKIILEAFTDENPQIRAQAQAACPVLRSLHKCLRIGTEEIIALIRLMDEHYSTELMRTIDQLMYSSQTPSDIKEAGVSELVKLLSHKDVDVRSGILEIIRRMRESHEGAIPALVERLDEEEQMDIKSKIIRILVRFGPDAKQAVPILKKYLKHEDINFRRQAENAFRVISPAEADKILGTRKRYPFR